MYFPVWVLLALLVAVAQAGIALSNEHFRVKPVHLLWWMRLVSTVALIPVAFLFPLPHDALYYLYVLLSAAIFAYTDLYVIGLAAQSGAGVVTRLDPLITGATFILWTAVTPSLLTGYLDKPLHTAGILAALLGSTFFALRLRRCVVTSTALKIMAPIILLSAVGLVFGKLGMNRVDPKEGVFYYTFLQSIFVFGIYTLAMFIPAISRRVPDLALSSSLRDKRAIKAGLAAGLGWLIATPAKWYAITFVANPAYVGLVAMTQPLWVMLAYRLMNKREEADIVSGLGIVFCAALLVVCTSF